MPTARQPSAQSATRFLPIDATGQQPASALVASGKHFPTSSTPSPKASTSFEGAGLQPRHKAPQKLAALAAEGISCIALALFLAPALSAQTHKVAATETVTRAVAVYEWTGDIDKPTAARLVPVSLFIGNKLEDAGTYFARPIPLALLNGNIYSLEKSGTPQGNVTLDYARHLQTATNAGTDDSTDLGWFGYGTYSHLPAPKKAAPLRASRSVSEIVSSKDADRPTFAKRTSTPTKEDQSRVDPVTPAARPAPDASTAAPAAPEDPDRPHLTKPKADPASTTPAASTTTTATPAASTSETPDTKPPVTSRTDTSKPDAGDTDRPTLRHRDPKQAEADRLERNKSRVETVPGGLNNDPDRPSMKRGKTPEQQAAAQLTGLPAALHQSIAVSDAVNREPHPFARSWSTPTERADTLAKIEALAQRELAAYIRVNNSTSLPTGPGLKPLPRSRRGPPVKPLNTYTAPLTNESLTPLTLSYGGLPTFVYTAISPASTPLATAPVAPEQYITLVAQQVPSGELQVAFSSVTDATHLDRTPWFRFVDAVDPDASHRASLLFELRAQHSRQFALYTILTAKADQTFLTNPTD